jgi:hypothetical protein
MQFNFIRVFLTHKKNRLRNLGIFTPLFQVKIYVAQIIVNWLNYIPKLFV